MVLAKRWNSINEGRSSSHNSTHTRMRSLPSCSLNSVQRQSRSQERTPSLVRNCADGVAVANIYLTHLSFDRSFSCALQRVSTSDMSLNTVQVASIWTLAGGRTGSKLGRCSASCSGVVSLLKSTKCGIWLLNNMALTSVFSTDQLSPAGTNWS